MIRLPAVSLLACFAAGCATIDYVGESYPPTAHIDIFFSETDVSKPFKVIGQVLASGDQFTTASRLNAKMQARAREVGADAVIILQISRTPIQGPDQVTETTTISTDADSKTIKRTATTFAPADHDEIKALFIKYK